MNTEASYHLKLYTDKLPLFFFRRCKEVSLKGRKDNVASYIPWNFANSNPIINPIPQRFHNS